MRTYGRAAQGDKEQNATDQTLFIIMSCTKAITSAAAWLLINTVVLPVMMVPLLLGGLTKEVPGGVGIRNRRPIGVLA